VCRTDGIGPDAFAASELLAAGRPR
jgi:hypothetical protein